MSPDPVVIGNYISEWFGHRMYPNVVSNAHSLADQKAQRCPFLSQATGQIRECIKAESSKGVCTIDSGSNGARQDWVVCPYRAFDRGLTQEVAARFYGAADFHMFAAPVLAAEMNQARVLDLLSRQERVLIYFDQKMGGEIGVAATERSPEIAFDTTFVELAQDSGGTLKLGKFAVMEIQTMDFHGSYRHAVSNLNAALRLHRDRFPHQVQENQQWLSDHIEGPNIANVFKRTFWQMMFKFEMAASPGCAGVALTIPRAVWDSWQKFLGAPDLVDMGDGTFTLEDPKGSDSERTSWIYVFDFESDVPVTPSPMRINRVIRTTASALAHHALEEAPKGAMGQLERAIYPVLEARLRRYWPETFQLFPGVPPNSGVRIEEDPRPIEEIVREDGG